MISSSNVARPACESHRPLGVKCRTQLAHIVAEIRIYQGFKEVLLIGKSEVDSRKTSFLSPDAGIACERNAPERFPCLIAPSRLPNIVNCLPRVKHILAVNETLEHPWLHSTHGAIPSPTT
jgi:hypothetical protein